MPRAETTVLPTLTVMGLMSGTSVDGVDAACVRVSIQTKPFRLRELTMLGTHTVPMPSALRESLLRVMQAGTVPLAALCGLNMQVGALFSQTARELMLELQGQGVIVDVIASHGQTLFHVPPGEDGALGSTLQIGEPALIAELTGVEVIADFRPGDMAAGGHGAPLVPFADVLLFQDEVMPRAVQNIGGIANLTALPPRNQPTVPVMAFDTGPGNMMIDAMTQALFDQPYDRDGLIAQQGQVYAPLLDTLMAHPYLSQSPSKSTGRELFGAPFALSLWEEWQSQLSPEDMVATLTQFTASSIADAYRRFVCARIPVQEVIVGGGGVMNPTLMAGLAQTFAPMGIQLKRHEDFGIDSRYKEAIAFALLGYARKVGMPNNVPSCTGAQHPVVLGGSWVPFRGNL